MFDICPHCGNTIGGTDQVVGQMLVCRSCGKDIGIVPAKPEKVVVDRAEEIIRSGSAARCSVCGQLVEVKVIGSARSRVPHWGQGEKRRMCPGGGKPVANAPAPTPAATTAPPAKKPGGKDLSAYMNREQIQVVACRRDGEPTIEALTLEYLDKADRVRLQIEALRDILGKSFQMKPYPPALNRPNFAVWSNAACCVIGKKHDAGGYQAINPDELNQAVEDLRRHRALFFP